MLINSKFRCARCMKELNEEFKICSCGCDNSKVTNDSHCLQIGTVLDGNYVIGEVLEAGGLRITYVGYDMNLEIKVVINEYCLCGLSTRDTDMKSVVVTIDANENELYERGQEQFINEAKVLLTFDNEPGIVPVYNFFRENSTAYIVSEYVEGITLEYFLRQKGKLSIDETIEILEPVINALTKGHENNLIHGELNPDSIVITNDGRGKLLDFGISREHMSYKIKKPCIGIFSFFAPMEIYMTEGKYGPWTDVYSICAIIYKCITGKNPTEAGERLGLDRRLEPIHKLESSCSKEINNVILKGLSLEVEDRYQTVSEFKEALFEAIRWSDAKKKKDIKRIFKCWRERRKRDC